ncbi:MAG: peptidyl-tRNA hydrolase Pth2 [Methanomethylovorans sp.]|uniref:peptidyl-tRNA hydrolase Pth2 n=1 Tax=Methanomethylovorans sp. TaxID=2758717 RepID=UPI000B09631F|nr:peptidyl-tRNA hydrolase Pth2 [Methanomethylovorans sp.]
MDEYKQCIVVRDDLKLSKGKLAVQVAHAAVSASSWASRSALDKWKEGGQKKVVLRVPTLKDLFELKEKARREGFSTALITDAGLTEIEPGTVTVLGIGPAKAQDIDRITKDLKLL